MTITAPESATPGGEVFARHPECEIGEAITVEIGLGDTTACFLRGASLSSTTTIAIVIAIVAAMLVLAVIVAIAGLVLNPAAVIVAITVLRPHLDDHCRHRPVLVLNDRPTIPLSVFPTA